MLRSFLYSKIHRATVTSVDIDYEGSLTVDPELLDLAGIRSFERIDVLNINNGNRFTTYAIPGKRKSGEIQVNGAAAHLCKSGDLVIIVTYCSLDENEVKEFKPKVVLVDSKNKPVKVEEKTP